MRILVYLGWCCHRGSSANKWAFVLCDISVDIVVHCAGRWDPLLWMLWSNAECCGWMLYMCCGCIGPMLWMLWPTAVNIVLWMFWSKAVELWTKTSTAQYCGPLLWRLCCGCFGPTLWMLWPTAVDIVLWMFCSDVVFHSSPLLWMSWSTAVWHCCPCLLQLTSSNCSPVCCHHERRVHALGLCWHSYRMSSRLVPPVPSFSSCLPPWWVAWHFFSNTMQ